MALERPHAKPLSVITNQALKSIIKHMVYRDEALPQFLQCLKPMGAAEEP